jgi:DNA-binding CsgD family transcriptional regulator
MATRNVPQFRDRLSEREVLEGVLASVRGGASSVLVVRGEAGVGKSALLQWCEQRAVGFRMVRVAGVESEMELPYAGLQLLCAPLIDHLDALPEPQQRALRIAFALEDGDAPARFFVALAALGLLSEAAADQPLLCVIDDAQWLDEATSSVLGFVARRLAADSVAMVFAVREPSNDRELVGLPALRVAGLDGDDARALLSTVIPGRLDDHVRDRIVAETRGNPLALLELPRGLTAAELGGGFALTFPGGLSGRIEELYLRRFATLPEATRRLVLLAAADPTGEAAALWRAADTINISAEAAYPAEAEKLLEIDTKVRFHHPLVRSAVYRAAEEDDRRAVHLALAATTDPQLDPDRRAWHLAAAAPGPDELVASELERSAGRAQARGGVAAAAAFLERSVALTEHPGKRTDRTLAAALASLHAGAFDTARGLVAAARAGELDEVQQARADLLDGQIAFASSVGSAAPPLLLQAARRLEPLDGELARETYLDAWGAALFAGRLARAGTLLEVSSAAARPAPHAARPDRPSDVLLDALSTLVTRGRAAAAPALRLAASAFAAAAVDDNFRGGWLTTVPCNVLWDEHTWHDINVRQIQLARDSGALARLPIDLTASAVLAAWRGDFEQAAAAIAEAEDVTRATKTHMAPYGAMLLAGLRGREPEASALIASAVREATAGGQGIGVQYADWVAAILANGLSRFDAAHDAAQRASDDAPELFLSAWALPELIEASTRTGDVEVAAHALGRLTEATSVAGTDWALGIEARCRALLSDGDAAERDYLEAIDRLQRTGLAPEVARAHLLYGEWLVARQRRADAATQLQIAHEMFTAIGMEAFQARARGALHAAGHRARADADDVDVALTPQELQIAQLAVDGRTNAEIGAALYLSARTVEWHLRKVFLKLGIASRKELARALPDRPRNARAPRKVDG